VGPFKAAGFQYTIESAFLTGTGNQKEPDIVASSDDGWLILELTYKPKSKAPVLDSYESIDPRYLGQYGLQVHVGQPDIISSRLIFVDDGQHCQIVVKDRLEVRKDEFLSNDNLRDELQKAGEEGYDLGKLPEIPITLLPEMNKFEIRRGLLSIILKLFDPVNKGMTALEMVDEGLERVAEIIPVAKKHTLVNKVKEQMLALTTTFLDGYFSEEDGVYKTTDLFKQHPTRRELIVRKMQEWAFEDNQMLLDHFINKNSSDKGGVM